MPALPANAGVGLLVAGATGLIVTTGATVSTVNDGRALTPLLPASSCCSACTVYVPSGSLSTGPVLHEPPLTAATTARTSVAEAYTLTVTDARSPCAVS